MKTITHWTTLMQYAKELGNARLIGNEANIAIAKEKHDNYASVCLKSDRMVLNCTKNDLGCGI